MSAISTILDRIDSWKRQLLAAMDILSYDIEAAETLYSAVLSSMRFYVADVWAVAPFDAAQPMKELIFLGHYVGKILETAKPGLHASLEPALPTSPEPAPATSEPALPALSEPALPASLEPALLALPEPALPTSPEPALASFELAPPANSDPSPLTAVEPTPCVTSQPAPSAVVGAMHPSAPSSPTATAVTMPLATAVISISAVITSQPSPVTYLGGGHRLIVPVDLCLPAVLAMYQLSSALVVPHTALLYGITTHTFTERMVEGPICFDPGG